MAKLILRDLDVRKFSDRADVLREEESEYLIEHDYEHE